MRIGYVILAACLAATPCFARAGETQPPPPLPADQSLPPPVDLEGITPLPGNPDQALPQAPPPLPEVPATPTPRPLPTLAPPPTDTPVPEAAAPTPTVEEAAPAEVPAQAPAPARRETGRTPAGGPQAALTDYFPCAPGTRWSYKYLKPPEGGAAPTRDVECTRAKTMANGTLRADLKATEGGSTVVEKYSLYDRKVQHTFEGKEALADDIVFKLPPAGGESHWKRTDADGTVHDCKAVYGKAQVYRKTYPDCLIVWDKAYKGKDWSHTLISYYARGVGLVSVEFYLPGMKMVESKSIALAGE